MNKLRLVSIVFLIVAVIACIPLTIEIYGDMNTDVIIPSAYVFGGAIVVFFVLSYIRAIIEHNAKKK